MTLQGLNATRVVACLQQYLDQSSMTISRAQAEERMWAKLANPAFMADVRPCLRLMRLMVLTTLRLRQRSVGVRGLYHTHPRRALGPHKRNAEHHRMSNLATTE
jgi:hypothetical protein